MNIWLQYLLIGFGSGLIIFPIGIWIFNLFRNTIERRKVKQMIKQNQFLTTIDPRDFDHETWKNQIKINPADMENFNKKIFKKPFEVTA